MSSIIMSSIATALAIAVLIVDAKINKKIKTFGMRFKRSSFKKLTIEKKKENFTITEEDTDGKTIAGISYFPERDLLK